MRSAFGTAPSQVASTTDQGIRSELEQLYLKSHDRNLNVLIVVTGGALEGRQSYREQLFDALPDVPFHGWVSLEYYKDADHTFTSEGDRARLEELLLGWIKALPITQNPPLTSSGYATSAVLF